MSLLKRPKTILIDVIPPTLTAREARRRISELEALTDTYGGLTVVKIIQKRQTPDYRTYVGSGKIREIAELARSEQADLIVINNTLKPKQLFAIEELVRKNNSPSDSPSARERRGRIGRPIQVWDRVDLILKIFSQHAHTVEAKLQIKLAAIRHMGPRIFGMGMELMQQAGGIGTRGRGETNIEIMRRHLAEQERQVKTQLAACSQTRGLQRARRTRLGLKTVSIVGYTNAGKSSLLNALTHTGAYVADELFATLDTRVGTLWLAPGTEILLSDTIGFIQDLPPELIQAFRSTLEETVKADLLLHVIDVTDPFMTQKITEVEAVLRQLDITDTPKIYVFSKIDLKKRLPRLSLGQRYRAYTPVFVSARTADGLDMLKERIRERILT